MIETEEDARFAYGRNRSDGREKHILALCPVALYIGSVFDTAMNSCR